MQEIKTEIVIMAPAAKVWKVLMDFKAYGEWNPFIKEIEVRDGQPVQVGAKLRAVLKNGEKDMTIKPKVLAHETNQEFKWKGSLPLGTFTGKHYFRVEKLDEGSCKLVHGEHFTGWLSGFILKKVGKNTRNGFIAMNKALKQRAES